VKLRRVRSTTSLLNEKPIEAWFEPTPRPAPRTSRPCNACCKTPGFGCAKNYACPCHNPKETKENDR